ncbi:MAG: helix-turn-helix transcriptional regulator [Caldisericia bacterium]|nr:helix-turn-helix transcriptional regulator [Caldisericia bacterium]
MELLKKEKRYLSTNEIAEKLKVGKSTTIMSLRKMRDRGEIKFKKEGNSFYYKA